MAEEKVRAECPQCHARVRAGRGTFSRARECPKCKQQVRFVVMTDEQGGRGDTEELAAVAPSDVDDEAGADDDATGTCPQCSEEMAPEAVVCIECGYNRKTGKRVKSSSRKKRKKGKGKSTRSHRAAQEEAEEPLEHVSVFRRFGTAGAIVAACLFVFDVLFWYGLVWIIIAPILMIITFVMDFILLSVMTYLLGLSRSSIEVAKVCAALSVYSVAPGIFIGLFTSLAMLIFLASRVFDANTTDVVILIGARKFFYITANVLLIVFIFGAKIGLA